MKDRRACHDPEDDCPSDRHERELERGDYLRDEMKDREMEEAREKLRKGCQP